MITWERIVNQYLQQYWPVALLSLWLGYRWWSGVQLRNKLPQLKKSGALLVDVRSENEFLTGHAPNSINIPLQQLSQRLGEIPSNRPIVLACASGSRSSMAKLLLKKHGHQEVYNAGSWTNLSIH